MLRQAVNTVKVNAEYMEQRRKSRDLAYSGTKSKIRENMKSLKRAKTKSVSPTKRAGPEHSLIDNLALEKSIEVTDVSVTLRGTISPIRLQKDP